MQDKTWKYLSSRKCFWSERGYLNAAVCTQQCIFVVFEDDDGDDNSGYMALLYCGFPAQQP